MAEPEKPLPYSRPRRSRTQGELALLTAAVELLHEKDPADVTTGDIAERAGLNRAHIVRYFGTRHELLSAAVEHYFFEVFPPAQRPEVVEQYFNRGEVAEVFLWRSKVVSYLLSIGVPPSRFHESQRHIKERIATFMGSAPLSQRMNKTLANISVMLTQAYQAFAELDEISAQDRLDIFLVITQLNQLLIPLDEKLGWANEK